MIGSRDDLREALGNELNLVLLDGGNPDELAEQFLAGPLAPILAQVSALQAEVERERHNKEQWRDQSYENAKAADRLSAEVERLQKVEGEREKDAERVPSGPCWSDKPEPVPVSALRATITSRDAPPTHISFEGIEGLLQRLAKRADTDEQDRALFAEAGVRLREYHPEAQQIIADTRGRWEAFSELDCDSDPSIDPLAGYSIEWLVGWWRNGAQEADLNIHVGSGKNAERQARSMAGSLNYLLSMQNAPAEPAPCDRSGEAGETEGLDPQGESTVTGAARQAPSDNPLTETKEGSDAR